MMRYFLNLFSPSTYLAFSESSRDVSGFSPGTPNVSNVSPGDRFICYMTKVSRWVGVFEVLEGPYDNDTPIFSNPDPYTRRFKIKPLVWLDRDFTIPIKNQNIWNALTFTGDDKKYWPWNYWS